jgi:hypothetical protein
MRQIAYNRWNPNGGTIPCEQTLTDFLLEQAYIALYVRRRGHLPPIEDVNQLLQSGAGDDGFIGLTWEPFTISDEEYQQLTQQISE